MQLVGLARGAEADQTTLGQWLRAQTAASVRAWHRINAALVDWASGQAQPGRWLHGGEAEVFFDDPEIEVLGHKFAGARKNYEGHRAFSWQTLWYGPWLLDGILDGAGDVSAPKRRRFLRQGSFIKTVSLRCQKRARRPSYGIDTTKARPSQKRTASARDGRSGGCRQWSPPSSRRRPRVRSRHLACAIRR